MFLLHDIRKMKKMLSILINTRIQTYVPTYFCRLTGIYRNFRYVLVGKEGKPGEVLRVASSLTGTCGNEAS